MKIRNLIVLMLTVYILVLSAPTIKGQIATYSTTFMHLWQEGEIGRGRDLNRNSSYLVTSVNADFATKTAQITALTATDTYLQNQITGHVASTGTAVHGLGTMATQATTNYVATGTYDGHVASTGANVHGLGTISTQAANAVAITGGTASLTTCDISGSGSVATLTVTAVFKFAGLTSATVAVPAAGDAIFDTDVNKLLVYDGSNWQAAW